MNENEEPFVTEAELARVLELDAKATQGPIDVWTHETNGEVSYRLRAPAHRNMAWVAQYDDALALAEYRTLTPRLARELAAARAAIKVAREILTKAKKDSEHAFSPSAILEAFTAALTQLKNHYE